MRLKATRLVRPVMGLVRISIGACTASPDGEMNRAVTTSFSSRSMCETPLFLNNSKIDNLDELDDMRIILSKLRHEGKLKSVGLVLSGDDKEGVMQNGKKLILAVAAVLITVGALWLTSRSLAPKDATWEDVLAEARSGGYRLVTTEELRDRYQQEVAGLLLVDTRQEWEYRTGRIKGALNFPMAPTGWARWREAGSLEAFLGPDKERFIVFY